LPDPDRAFSITTTVRKIGNPLSLGMLWSYGGPSTGNSGRNGLGHTKLNQEKGYVSSRGKTLIAHHNLDTLPYTGTPFYPTWVIPYQLINKIDFSLHISDFAQTQYKERTFIMILANKCF